MTGMALFREDITGMLASLPPKARGRGELERIACKLTAPQIAFELELEAITEANVKADPEYQAVLCGVVS